MRYSDTQDSLVHDLNCLDSEDLSSESQKLLTPLKQVDPPMDSVTTSTLPLKRKQAKAPLVDTEVRRSDRLKGKHQCFKMP
jgi:hypothetical protein